MKGLIQKANCPSCGKPLGLLLTFRVTAWPESFLQCRYCGERVFLPNRIFWMRVHTWVIGFVLIWLGLMLIFRPIFEADKEPIKTIVGIVLVIAGFLGG